MTNTTTDLPITPDQMKSIATKIRGIEKDRLGSALPQTTVLNAITQALGLGSSFSAIAKAQVAQPAPRLFSSVFACFAFETWKGMGSLSALDEEFFQSILPPGWTHSIDEPRNGFEVIEFKFTQRGLMSEEQLVKKAETGGGALDSFAAAQPLIGHSCKLSLVATVNSVVFIGERIVGHA